MNASDMIPGVVYVVTKASTDGTLEMGDRVQMLLDGSLSNETAEGWLDPEEVDAVRAGVEVKPCPVYVEMLRKRAAADAATLAALGGAT